MTTGELFLRDVLDIPESVHAGDFKVELSGGFVDTQARVAEYVVTDQLRQAFGRALGIVRAAIRNNSSYAAYLHGSFGSGKSHFLTVLHAVLNNDPVARAKPGLQPVIADHDDWLRGRRFLMVPYHLVGATDIDSALLGGYVKTVRRLHPDEKIPPVYRADAMLADARGQREFLADDTRFIEWLGGGAAGHAIPGGIDDLDVIDALPVSGWTCAELDRAFAAPVGDPLRDGLVSALLSGPMSAYAQGASGDRDAFLPLEDGLSVISRHARSLGYDGLILFLDELILWLQAHMSDQQFVNTQVSKLVKLIESGEADRSVPIVSFISRQRDLSQLVGEDVMGADVKNLEAQVQYLAGRFDTISLEDRNLPAIIKERVLTPRSPQARAALDTAFAAVESAGVRVKDVLLDAGGATGADWADFRAVYPLSPALLNVLVALSGALQRERTGLKLLQEMLRRRRDDMRLGQLIPLGDLWDVLADGTGEAFTDRLRTEAEAAHRFHAKVRGFLLEKYGSVQDERFRADERFVKTLLLAALAPDVPALTRLTGDRLAALNHGSIRSRTVAPGSMVVTRLREIQAEFGELRADGEEDPVFTLHLSDLDIEPLLDMVGEQDKLGPRRIWVKDQLWSALGLRDTGEFVCEREIVWKGTRRTAEFVFANVRDTQDLPDAQFSPSVEGRIRFILDYPFDVPGKHPSDDAGRVHSLTRNGAQAATIVWLPDFLSAQKGAQLGRLLKIRYLLERDRLDDYAAHLPADDRFRVRHQLQAQRDNLTSQLAAVLQQLYGIAKADDANRGSEVGADGHVLSLLSGHRPTLLGGASFEHNVLALADGLLDLRYPKHPNFDPTGSRKPITLGELKIALGWITRAMEDGEKRIMVDRQQLALVKRIVHPLELGEVYDGPLNVSSDWCRRIDQYAAQNGITGDYGIEDIRKWIAKLGYTGLDKPVSSLIIATYALLADRAWFYHGSAVPHAPELERIGPGYALRAQLLPSEAEFMAARERAARLFGVHVPAVLLGRNVHRLAGEVRAKVTDLESPVTGVRRSLDKHAEVLGLSGQLNLPRVVTARCAADLLARLSAVSDATSLLCALADASYQISDEVLGAAIASAPTVLAALDRADWTLLESVRGFTGRGDGPGDQAERLVAEVARAAAADEFTRALVPVLDGMRDRAVTLISEAARLTRVTVPIPPSPKPGLPISPAAPTPLAPEAPSGPTASGPGTPEPVVRSSRRVPSSRFEAALAGIISDVQAEIRDYATAHPSAEVEIEISWRAVDSAERQGSQDF